MSNRFRDYMAPAVFFVVFMMMFHYYPRVIEEHFNVLVLASVFCPFAVVTLSRARFLKSLIQSVALQVVFIFYGKWYWQYRDALSDHYFSFENYLRIDLLIGVFAVSLVLASVARLVRNRFQTKSAH